MHQPGEKNEYNPKPLKIWRLIAIVAIFLLLLSMAALVFFMQGKTAFGPSPVSPGEQTQERVPATDANSTAIAATDYFNPAHFDTSKIANPEEAAYVRYGLQLITETYRYIGPEAKDKSHRYSGNNLACGNCHLQGGIKAFSAPFVGVWGSYPSYRGRSNAIGTLEDRINGCMERSMNGKMLPIDSREMKAMMSYIKFLNKGVPAGEHIKGQGFIAIQYPDRAADPAKGEKVFQQYCSTCHGADGQGKRNGRQGDAGGYKYPPLWGGDSFNDGAGMHRLLTAARFIKASMPYGATAENPVLTDEQAYDVAAYINSFPRPEKAHKEKDYPDLSKKPVDCPYPPYADNLSLAQHRLGPYPHNNK